MELSNALYLLPVPIGESPVNNVIPAGNLEIIKELRYFIVENVRTVRRFLKLFIADFPIGECEFYELNRHTDPMETEGFLKPLEDGKPMGLMSEAGCPAVADPGSQIVALAHHKGLKVIPLVGPSSIMLSLMASGFNGQRFSFQGYLPIDKPEKERKIKELESLSAREDMTQIFIETPYRNNKLIETLINVLNVDTMLCVACDMTSPENETVISKRIKEWKGIRYNFDKRPAIFMIYSNRQKNIGKPRHGKA